MKFNYSKSVVALLSILMLLIYGEVCFSEQTNNNTVDEAIAMYENGNYDMADKLIFSALKKDKRDVAALTWYALIKMELAKNKRDIYPDACKLVVNQQLIYLNTYYGVDLLFFDDDKLYSYYYAAYAKAYWLTNNKREIKWFLDKSLSLYPNNYEALHVEGQMALGMVEKGSPSSLASIFNDPIPENSDLKAAFKYFLAEMEAAGNNAPEIKSRAAYWAAGTLYRQNKKEINKTKELLETSIKSNPNGIYAGLSKNSLEKILKIN